VPFIKFIFDVLENKIMQTLSKKVHDTGWSGFNGEKMVLFRPASDDIIRD